MLFGGQKQANEGQANALPHVSEHDAEEDAVGDGHEGGRVILVVVGQAVHPQEGLENPAQQGIFQLGGRGQLGLLRLIHHIVQLAIGVHPGQELGQIVLGHPAHEVEGLFGAGAETAHLHDLVFPAQPGPQAQKVVLLLLGQVLALVFQLSQGLLVVLHLVAQGLNGLLSGAAQALVQGHRHKVHGVEEGVHLLLPGLEGEVTAVHLVVLRVGGEEEAVLPLVQHLGEGAVAVLRQVPEAEGQVVHVAQGVQLHRDASQLLQLGYGRAVVRLLLAQGLLPLVHLVQLLGEVIQISLALFQVCPLGKGAVFRLQFQPGEHFLCLPQQRHHLVGHVQGPQVVVAVHHL